MLHRKNRKKLLKILLISILAVLVCGVFVFCVLAKSFGEIKYNSQEVNTLKNNVDISIKNKTDNTAEIPVIPNINQDLLIPVTHIKTPPSVKALYVSSWVAGSSKYIDPIIALIDKTEINSIIIDIKDSTGKVSFITENPDIQKIGTSENRISNVRALIDSLHRKNIYVIGRISVFQDPYLAKIKPEWAIKKKSDGAIWKDRKGLSFLDPTKKEVHDYIITLAKESYMLGFDEINFDYIRYPSDGNINDINYQLGDGKTRADNMEAFFKYLSSELKKDIDIPISADLFGLTTEGKDDMGIGQVWERTLPYFDFICPMVYPSHYPSGYSDYKNPALYPYEVVNKALASAIVKTKTINENINKIRPWLQDFDLGATYTKEMIQAQIKATYDNKLNSWMLWDPSNKYTPSALLENEN